MPKPGPAADAVPTFYNTESEIWTKRFSCFSSDHVELQHRWHWLGFVHSWRPGYSAEFVKHYHGALRDSLGCKDCLRKHKFVYLLHCHQHALLCETAGDMSRFVAVGRCRQDMSVLRLVSSAELIRQSTLYSLVGFLFGAVRGHGFTEICWNRDQICHALKLWISDDQILSPIYTEKNIRI